MTEYSVLDIISIQDVIDEYREMELPKVINNNGENVVDDRKIINSINSAETHIAGYLRRIGIDIVNMKPITKTELRIHALNLTRYYMSNDNGSTTENIKSRYEMSVSFLKDIASGKAMLSTGISRRSAFSQFRII